MVDVGGKVYSVSANQLGNYEKLYIEPKAKVTARISFPDGSVGDPVSAEVEDGGTLAGEKMGQVLTLDSQKTAQVDFQANEQDGIYRILFRRGAEVKVLNFWVGQPVAYHD